jgi:hypothetical protein
VKRLIQYISKIRLLKDSRLRCPNLSRSKSLIRTRVQRSARKHDFLYLKVAVVAWISRYSMMGTPAQKDLKGLILNTSKERRKRTTQLTIPMKKRIKVKKKRKVRRLNKNKRRVRCRYRRMPILSKTHLQSLAST